MFGMMRSLWVQCEWSVFTTRVEILTAMPFNNCSTMVLQYKTQWAPAASCRHVIICMTVWSVCITVSGSAVVGAAVIMKQLRDEKRKVVFRCFEQCLEVALGSIIFVGEELQRSTELVLSVPHHRVAAHAEALTHSALQCHGDFRGTYQISRLENYYSKTCSIWRQPFSRLICGTISCKLVMKKYWRNLFLPEETQEELKWACQQWGPLQHKWFRVRSRARSFKYVQRKQTMWPNQSRDVDEHKPPQN